MGLLVLARPHSYKTRRQLVHCRIDGVKCRSKPVISRTKLADNSCDTSIRQLVRCRIDVVATRRNVVVLKPVISRHYTVLNRSMLHGTRHNSHYVAMVDRRLRTRENLRQKTKCVRQLFDNLRMSYEKSSAHSGRSYGEIFKPFKNLVGSPRQSTRYGDMLGEQST